MADISVESTSRPKHFELGQVWLGRWHWARAIVGCSASMLFCASLAAQPIMTHENFADKLMQMGTGPTFSINAVASAAMQLGIAQEDLVTKLYRDTQQTRRQNLRTVAMLHESPHALIVNKAVGVSELHQTAGKTMNLANRGSGQFASTAAILRALDLRLHDRGGASYLPTSEFERAFCDKKVDVVVEVVAHPSALFEQLLACGGQFLDIPAPVVARMIAENPFVMVEDIAAKAYDGQAVKVSTLGMRNVLITSAQVSEEATFKLTTSLLQREDQLRSAQVLLRSMPAVAQNRQGALPTPLHPGAARALQSAHRLAAQ